MKESKGKGKALVVGGSIAGLSCAHALIAAGWEVVVLEKTCSPPTGCATGAGLGLDPLAQKLVQSWLREPHLLHRTTLPLTIDQVNQPNFIFNKNLPNAKFYSIRPVNKFDLISLLIEPSYRWGQEDEPDAHKRRELQL